MLAKLILILILSSAAILLAGPPLESLEDLKMVEKQIQQVVRANTDATVSLVSPRLGASGSGVIVSSDGLILTAAHVIEGSELMTVIFPDGSQEEARVLGANYNRDAAMAKLVGDGPWPWAEIGESRSLEVGDLVVAMGHPKGYDPTRRPPVRFGRVMTKRERDFITTDCALIGGDSGGPLFDLSGRVVGIHSNIAANRQVNNHAGLSGFLKSWHNMRDGKTWGALGGDRRDPNRPVLGLNLMRASEGLVVAAVPARGPAHRAGFLAGDRVTTIAGQEVETLEQLSEVFVDVMAGSVIKVTLVRGAETLEKTVKLARLADLYRN